MYRFHNLAQNIKVSKIQSLKSLFRVSSYQIQWHCQQSPKPEQDRQTKRQTNRSDNYGT